MNCKNFLSKFIRLDCLTLSYAFVVLLSSCNPMGDNSVEVLTQGALDPVSFSVEGGSEQGEFLVGSDNAFFTLNVQNNNAFVISNMSLSIDPFSSATMKFASNDEGKSISPGQGGSCGLTLEPGKECTYIVEYSPTFSGDLSQDFEFIYSNLVNTVVEKAEINLLAGEAANLAFVSEIINYDYGYMERTEPQKISKKLTVINNGGLTARDVVFGVLYSHNSGAFKILDNTCTEEIPAGESCSFIVDYLPQNYSAEAPDGEAEATYTCNPRFDYVRDPQGGKGALTAYFTALSTTIEGRILSSGITQLEYSELTVGNKESKSIKIQNYGYKEAIVHNVEVYDSSDSKVATCIKIEGSDELICQDPDSVSVDGAALPISTLPLKITDLTGCINKYEDLDYSRDDLGVLSHDDIYEIEGKTNTAIGGSCFLDMTFWPSVEHTINGNINDYKLRFTFDSTWKNAVVIYGQDNTYDQQFLISEARWLSAASVEVSEYKYGTRTDYTREAGSDSNVYLYDLGRIALISNDSYKQGVKISFKNTGFTDANVISVTDASTPQNILTEETVDLNNFYQSIGHVGCNVLSAIGGDCNIRFNLAPLASSLSGAAAENEENSNMFDVTNSYPNQYKKFILTYQDGTTYNDDGSLRSNRSIEVWARALLVRKGFLVFESTDADQGTSESTVGDTPAYHHIILKNAGTGGIPVIEKISEFSLLGTSQKSSDNPFPYEIVDRADVDLDSDGFFDGEDGADKDCYDLIVEEGAALAGVVSGTNAESILGAGETCSLTVKMKLRGNDVYRLSDYNGSSMDEWDRFFDTDYQNTHELWEEDDYNAGTFYLSFRYYDGDGIADASNGYDPAEVGYGNYYTISGGTESKYGMDVRVRSTGTLVPISPLPSIASVICRDEVQLPAYTTPADEWGSDIAAATINEMCVDYSNGGASSQASYYGLTENYVKTNYSGYDYIFHAGTFSAGNDYDLSFRIEERGNQGVKNPDRSYTGDTSIISWTNPWNNSLINYSNRELKFVFSPTAAGTYSTDLVVVYDNGEKILNDEDSLSFTDQRVTLRVKIIAEAINSGMDNISLKVQDYAVTYDSVTETIDDTVLNGSEYDIGLHYRLEDMTDLGTSFYAIRESSAYAKKVYTFKNNGSNTITGFIFNVKDSIIASNFAIPAGTGISINENNCVNITLNSGDECTVTMHFQASKDEVNETTAYGTIVYNMGGIAYQMKNFEMKFESADPAILETSPKIATKIIKDENNLNITSIPIDLGLYTDSSHPVIESYPSHRYSKLNVNLTNISSEKASFLAQWRSVNGSDALPSGTWIEIYDTDGIIVEANRPCFYGDDEGDAMVSDDNRGFNTDSVNACLMNFYIDLDGTYFGEELDSSQNYFKLLFYNNMRASTDEIIFHFTGFIEPNPSQMTNTEITNVDTDNDGNLYFEWDSAVASNSSWGGIIGYRVFYSATKNSLNDIFKASTYTDTTNEFVDITGLVPGRYYYLKVVALRRTPGGKEYVSDINSTIKEVIIPAEGYVYNYDQQVLFSKNYSSEGGPDLKEEGSSVCASSSVTLSENGAVKNKAMKLVNTSIWEIIESDDSYSDYDISSTPHWMSDSPVDISAIFTDFTCSETSGSDGEGSFYTKECSDCSCNDLSIAKGGDGQFLPPGSTIYIDGGSFSAFFRCYIDQ